MFSQFFIYIFCMVSYFLCFELAVLPFCCLQVSSFDLGRCVILSIILLFDLCVCADSDVCKRQCDSTQQND
jgi:hypothetical protein